MSGVVQIPANWREVQGKQVIISKRQSLFYARKLNWMQTWIEGKLTKHWKCNFPAIFTILTWKIRAIDLSNGADTNMKWHFLVDNFFREIAQRMVLSYFMNWCCHNGKWNGIWQEIFVKSHNIQDMKNCAKLNLSSLWIWNIGIWQRWNTVFDIYFQNFLWN